MHQISDPPPLPCALVTGSWAAHGPLARLVRNAVFIDEQRFSRTDEYDGHDADAIHLLALAPSGAALGTARLLRADDTGHSRVGRVAVLADYRGRGIASAMVAHLLSVARWRMDHTVMLSAQVSALGLYQRLGFVAVGARFDDGGIAHQMMQLSL